MVTKILSKVKPSFFFKGQMLPKKAMTWQSMVYNTQGVLRLSKVVF